MATRKQGQTTISLFESYKNEKKLQHVKRTGSPGSSVLFLLIFSSESVFFFLLFCVDDLFPFTGVLAVASSVEPLFPLPFMLSSSVDGSS